MAIENYDLRLLMYQTLLEIPAQVLAAETYEKMGKGRFSSYLAMSVLGIGASLACAKLGRGAYQILHGDKALEREPGTPYYVSPLTEYLVTHNFKEGESLTADNISALERSKKLLEDAPAYSKGYMQAAYTSVFGKVAYSTAASEQSNLFLKVLYGVSQPLGVVLKDQEVL
tara:strand:- start:1118 stop:1630 length:513 start_codon:yes stop_codon:yes gene_type:complete